MPTFNEKVNKDLNGFNIKVYDVNLDDPAQKCPDPI